MDPNIANNLALHPSNKHTYSLYNLHLTDSRINTKHCPNHKSSLMRLNSTNRLITLIAIYINIFTILSQTSLFCHSTLLTNIYGKKLSQLTDISHRYLIVPSPLAHNNDYTSNIDSSSSSNSGNSNYNSNIDVQDNSQNDLPSDNYQNKVGAGGTRSGRDVGKASNKFQDDPNNDDPSTELQALPVASPLTAAWRQQQQQQQQQSKAAKLSLQANGSSMAMQPAGDEIAFFEQPTTVNPNVNNLGSKITNILKKFFLHGYDKRVRPNYSGPPVLVNVTIHIIGISSVDEVQMDFTTDFYFRQKWYDPRLTFDPVEGVNELCVGAEFAERIWLPDTFFANEKTATFHRATTENTFIRIANTGQVYRSIRLTVTCSCPMDLQYFPMDRQRCKIEIESYGYDTHDIMYIWDNKEKGKNDSVTLETKIELPQFKILGHRMGEDIQNLSSGIYIRLYCEIHFVRSMGYYLIQIYIPASLIVMISWVSFWLHRNATPARVALGVTTVLTMTTLMSSTNAALPKISYIKSIDVFLGTCFVMVFASLLEYASVGYIGKRIAMKRKRLQDLQQMQQHHQKVCVAAAASAAAAAAAAQESNPIGVAPRLGGGSNQATSFFGKQSSGDKQDDIFDSGGSGHQHASGSQTMRRTATGAKMFTDSGSKTLQRNPIGHTSSTTGGLYGGNKPNDNKKGAPSPMTPVHRFNPSAGAIPPVMDLNNRGPMLAASAAIAAAAAINQPSHGATTEFEVSQTHDLIRICGLTPSAVDKHSRVVFPICFICFNLMYWIIYGHISQQVEDNGPPLIPFNKN